MEYAENERELAEKLGYTKSSFSQIVNGKVPLSERFVQKLASVDRNINEVWIMTGEGNMLNSVEAGTSVVTIPANVWEVIQTQAESLKSKDKQIDELVALLKQQIAEGKKMPAQQGGNATSAVAG
ncbi:MULTISPECIES: helix-turn-helix domain-containing protein [Alistipes]|uniref:Helix-turn-helix transcriptional regulator n=2 Tax=Alistipes TaxID=239759 RepID=A0ABY5V281_9BACT|nr:MULTISPECIES: helix-turn-helix transcriptional regulator [Alistipes]UWN57963.1 helix-turn-helix transcriptional regulator [Alistipes ihumii AP11]